jgi:small subunit ribosomal protein S20
MAKVHLSVKKRARQNEARREQKSQQRSALRTAVKKASAALEAGDLEAATVETSQAVRALGKAASKGLIHRNQASRKISRLTRHLNALATPEA